MHASDQIKALSEITVGGVVGTGYLWMPLLDQFQAGLHLYSAIGGAVIVTIGLCRLWRSRE